MADIINEYPTLVMGHTTKGLYIGLPEAEDESPESRGLSSFYEDVHGIMDRLKNETFIITGRKGCGKTSFVKYLKKQSNPDGYIHCSVFLPKDYDLEKLILNIDVEGEKKYKLLYEWIILVRFTEMILDVNVSRYATAIQELEKFWLTNSGHLKIGKLLLDSKEVESNNGGEISLWDKIKFFFSKNTKGSYKRPSYTQLIDDLRKNVKKALLYQLHEGHTFYLLFDDLDEDFNVNDDDDCRRILALIDVAKQFNCDFIEDVRGKVIVMLRDDLLDKMSGLSTSFTKTVKSCSYQIRWYDPANDNSDEHMLHLRKLINKRLSINFEHLGVEYDHDDPWSTFVDNTVQVGYGYKSAFKYILGYTQCRPRDFMYLFQGIGDCDYRMPLDEEAVKQLLKNYVDTAFNEASDELVGVLDSRESIKKLMDICEELSNMQEITYRVLGNRLNKNGFEDVEQYIRILVEYNIVIPVRDDKDRPHYLYPKLKGQLKDHKFHLPLWLRAHYNEAVINHG